METSTPPNFSKYVAGSNSHLPAFFIASLHPAFASLPKTHEYACSDSNRSIGSRSTVTYAHGERTTSHQPIAREPLKISRRPARNDRAAPLGEVCFVPSGVPIFFSVVTSCPFLANPFVTCDTAGFPRADSSIHPGATQCFGTFPETSSPTPPPAL